MITNVSKKPEIFMPSCALYNFITWKSRRALMINTYYFSTAGMAGSVTAPRHDKPGISSAVCHNRNPQLWDVSTIFLHNFFIRNEQLILVW